MQTGLENMRNKILQNTINWKQINILYDEFGGCKVIYYCKHQDLTCYMYFEKDMDQELYITKMEFYDGEEWEVE